MNSYLPMAFQFIKPCGMVLGLLFDCLLRINYRGGPLIAPEGVCPLGVECLDRGIDLHISTYKLLLYYWRYYGNKKAILSHDGMAHS